MILVSIDAPELVSVSRIVDSKAPPFRVLSCTHFSCKVFACKKISSKLFFFFFKCLYDVIVSVSYDVAFFYWSANMQFM